MLSMLGNKEHLLVLPRMILLNGKIITQTDVPKLLVKSCYGDGHIRLIEDFYGCVREGRDFSINGAEASKVVRTILAAYVSKGETVPVK